MSLVLLLFYMKKMERERLEKLKLKAEKEKAEKEKESAAKVCTALSFHFISVGFSLFETCFYIGCYWI